MSKMEWGNKRRCLSCSAAFYDLGKSPILCPKCGTEFNPDAIVKSRRPAKAEEKAVAKAAPKPVIPEEIVDGELPDDEIVDDFLEPDDELEEAALAEDIDVDPTPAVEEEH